MALDNIIDAVILHIGSMPAWAFEDLGLWRDPLTP